MQIFVASALCLQVILIGAFPESQPESKDQKILQIFSDAIENGNVKDVEELVREHGVGIEDNDGNTPLHHAVMLGEEEIANILVRNGADVNAKENESGRTPLHHAAVEGDGKIADLLLRYGTSNSEVEKHGRTALHLTAFVAKSLINHGANVNAEDNLHYTPLYIASHNGNDKLVQLLISHGANVNHQVLNNTSLLQASRYGHEKVVDLLTRSGAIINFADKSQKTPIHWAAQKGHKKIVDQLINSGADINRGDFVGQTPLHLAALNGYVETVKSLVKNGAVMKKDKFGNTPLNLSKLFGRKEVAKFLSENEPVERIGMSIDQQHH